MRLSAKDSDETEPRHGKRRAVIGRLECADTIIPNASIQNSTPNA
jgi:hypothetical protein